MALVEATVVLGLCTALLQSGTVIGCLVFAAQVYLLL